MLKGCCGAIVEVEEIGAVVVVDATDVDVIVEEDFFDELEHALTAASSAKKAKNETTTSPAFFALIDP